VPLLVIGAGCGITVAGRWGSVTALVGLDR
jgi:hypothetical protein